MNRDELILVIAGALFGAVLLGWVLRMFYSALNNAAGPRSIKKTAGLVDRLQEAQAAQLAAEERLKDVEHDLTGRMRHMQDELDAAQQHAARAEAQMQEMRSAYAAAISTRHGG